MLPWPGKKKLRVVTACLNASGMPDLTLHEVEVSYDEYTDGVSCDLVEERLREQGFDEPFLHFDEHDAPPFLVPAVQHYLSVSLPSGQKIHPHSPEDSACRVSLK